MFWRARSQNKKSKAAAEFKVIPGLQSSRSHISRVNKVGGPLWCSAGDVLPALISSSLLSECVSSSGENESRAFAETLCKSTCLYNACYPSFKAGSK